MKVHKLWDRNDSTLYQLSETRHQYVDCVHYDDDEVNAANQVDVKDCKDISYNHLLVVRSGEHLVYVPANDLGEPISVPVLRGDASQRISEHLIALYGNMVVLEHHLVENPSRVSDYDGFNWSPDHKL